MLTALNNGIKVYASQEIHNTSKKYSCSCGCGDEVRFREGKAINNDGTKRANCFALLPGVYTSSKHIAEKEDHDNTWHINMQNMIKEAMPYEIELEKTIDRNRADCWNIKQEYAIEVQHSPISYEEINLREQTYKKIVWLLDYDTYPLVLFSEKEFKDTLNILGDKVSTIKYLQRNNNKIIDTVNGIVFLNIQKNEYSLFCKITPYSKNEFRLEIMNKNKFIEYLKSEAIMIEFQKNKEYFREIKIKQINNQIDIEKSRIENERKYNFHKQYIVDLENSIRAKENEIKQINNFDFGVETTTAIKQKKANKIMIIYEEKTNQIYQDETYLKIKEDTQIDSITKQTTLNAILTSKSKYYMTECEKEIKEMVLNENDFEKLKQIRAKEILEAKETIKEINEKINETLSELEKLEQKRRNLIEDQQK